MEDRKQSIREQTQMINQESTTHTCKVDSDGKITVDRKAPSMLRETTFASDGTPIVRNIPAPWSCLSNEFVATYAGERQYNVDCNAGFQRWNGTQTSRQVCKALRRCGFNTWQVETITRAARKAEHRSLGFQF
jgi:hypothetical protein